VKRRRAAPAAKARAVLALLRGRTPTTSTHGELAPVDQLVCTILSQNTTDSTRDRAFANLKAAFPDWREVPDRPTDEIEGLIRVCGLANQKAPSIQRALRAVRDRTGDASELSLDFLRQMGVEDARAWLTAINGVGIKTASIVLLFGLGMNALPVDTHVLRVSGRLGLIPLGTNAERAHRLLEAIVPPADYMAFHLALIHHGRTVCRARTPSCGQCPLTDLCDWFAEATSAGAPIKPPPARPGAGGA
jgi:endonuclease-3